MNELQSNKNNLSNIPGGFAIMPNALLGFLSDRACVLFQKIYQCQFLLENIEQDGELWVRLSTYYLAQSLNKDHKTISIILDELLGLHIVLRHFQNRKNILYRINWEEILLMCDILCNVDHNGRMTLIEKCVQGNFTPISQLSADYIEQIKQKYPSKQCSGKISLKEGRFGENFPEQESFTEITSENDITETDINSGSGNISLKKDNVQGNIPSNASTFREILTTDIYKKEINKEKMRERSSQYKGDKEKNLLEYFYSRSFSFPVFDKIFLESFLNEDLNENDDNVIKSIKQVWNQLGYDEEFPENNYINLATFQNILFHSWQQLKQDYPDYSLSENDIKNIFGFLVVEHDGENCLYIDPSKLQDISAQSVHDIQELPAKEKKYSDRTSRRLFVDCISEIAERNDELLTSSEFVALLLLDYVESVTSGNKTVEITKMAYKNLLSQFADQSGVPVEDIQTLFKELPQKGKVKLSPQQLSPDKFFQYNTNHQQESEVEKLFKTKLAEQN